MDEQIKTFDDIELYNRVYYRGHPAYVTDKGEDVCEKVPNARHIQIQYVVPVNGKEKERVHERIVNTCIEEQRKLWVDWDNHLDPYGSDKTHIVTDPTE